MNTEQDKFNELKWKSGVLAPADAKRPRCRVLESLDGVNGKLVEDKTDLIDWLIVIAYETEENK
jgi:hypothetical protein